MSAVETVEPWAPTAAPPPHDPTPEPADHPAPMAPNWFGPHPEARQGRLSFDVGRASHWFATILMGMLVLVLGGGLALAAVMYFTGEAGSLAPTRASELWWGQGINLLIFSLPAMLWVAAFYEGGAVRLRDQLFLTTYRPGTDVVIGIAVAIGMVGGAFLLSFVLQQLGMDTENPGVEALGGLLSWPLVFFIPFAAAVGEEVFFRGFLQPRIGIVWANIAFGLVHMSYGTPLQVLVPLAFGFVFSWTVLRTRSLLPAIIAHFLFDFVMLAFTKVATDRGWWDELPDGTGLLLALLPF